MNITKTYLLSQARKMCLACQGQQKLCTEHCTQKSCPLFDIRKYMIEQSQQLTLFTYAGFKAEVENILQNCTTSFLREMYFSDIRKAVESEMLRRRCKLPEGNALTSWWGKVAALILPKYGWIKNHSRKRRSPMRGDDYLYILSDEFLFSDAIHDAELARL